MAVIRGGGDDDASGSGGADGAVVVDVVVVGDESGGCGCCGEGLGVDGGGVFDDVEGDGYK